MKAYVFRYHWMPAALACLLLAGCSTTSPAAKPLYVGLTVTLTDSPPRGKTAPPRECLITLYEPDATESRARRVAFRNGKGHPKSQESHHRPGPFKKIWHSDIALRTGGMKLASTEQKLDRRLTLPLKLDVFGVFDSPTTPIDRKTELGLNTISLGFGRCESEHFGWNLYGGFGVGEDRNHQVFLLSSLDVNFEYGVYYTGFAAEFYPWTMPHGQREMTWTERFERAKPYLVGGFEVGFVSAEADGEYKVASATFYKDGQTIRDWIFSFPVGLGWAIPLDEKWSFQTVVDYRFHLYRPEEYNGWTLVTALRRHF